MAVQLNTVHYVVVASKSDYKDGKPYQFTGSQDKRWHTVDRAASLSKAGFTVHDILEDGKTDVEGNVALLTRHGIKSEYAKEHNLEPRPTNGKKAAPAERTMAVSFEQQEIMAPPVRDMAKISTYISQQIVRGNMPIDSVNLSVTQAMTMFKALNVDPKVIQEAFASVFQPKK
jgi:hypothetical protein